MAEGIVTLLFTDLVGSTELLGRLGEDAADTVRRRHFAALNGAVAQRGGHVVKNLGDGLMVVFSSAVDAVGCAAAMQQRIAREEPRLGLRVGLHAGEPTREGADYFGMPVVIASRLCDRAQGGQILVSDLVHGLAGSRGGHEFRPLGPLELKGIGAAVSAFEVLWEPAEEIPPEPGAVTVTAARPPLPAALASLDRTAFVGRDDDLSRLYKAWRRARPGRAQVAMVSGEPGIGKTRLAAEFAGTAYADGAAVLFGRSDEELAIPYQPIAEALRTTIAGLPPAQVDPELGRLVPEAAASESPTRSDLDPATQRYHLFEAVSAFLGSLASEQPVVLVVDDLHWSDPPTLLLLRYLARSPTAPALLVVGTYRDTELSRTHPLAETLADLRRDGLVERVSLSGLTEEDFAVMLAAVAGHEAPRSFVRALHAETEGNPFFAEEALRHLTETGAIYERDGRWTSDLPVDRMGIPEGVKETIGRRLARLPDGCDEILGWAAVLGRTWEYRVLCAMAPEREEELLGCVEAALSAQLIVETDSGRHLAYSFTHALVRETLYEELSLPRKQRLHLRAAQAIESVHGAELDQHAAGLALHYGLAGAAAEPATALRWALRAGEVAAAQLAWEEAVAHWDAALELMPDAGAPDADRARLLERLGDIKYAANFDVERGTRQLEEALAIHERAGDAARAARTRSRIGRNLATYWGPVHDVTRAGEHLRAAEVQLHHEGEGAPLASAYLGLATVAIWETDVPEILRAAGRAMEIGERIGSEPLRANAAVLYAQGLWWQGRSTQARAITDDVWELADRLNHPWLAFLATWIVTGIEAWLGDPAEARRWCERELAKPRVAQASGQREWLENFMGWAAATSGDLIGAHEIFKPDQIDGNPFFSAELELRGGDVHAAIATLRTIRDEAHGIGNAFTAFTSDYRIAEGSRVLGDPAAEPTLRTAIDVAAGGGDVMHELIGRLWLTEWIAPEGRLDDARAELARCRAIFAAGEDWKARDGHMRLAEAAVAAAAGDPADAAFAAGLDVVRRYGMIWDEAQAWRNWAAASPPGSVAEKLDRALEIYDRQGAGAAWVESLARERERASLGAGS